ncbi:PIR protein [Plasmodium ovale]|uniref:PIR protein n=1 Tax=Plasmodium ovale TaxID=36330 RepID=A0A1D3JC32_PLAOA|nr:PIR protein [Plasmodium ovale]
MFPYSIQIYFCENMLKLLPLNHFYDVLNNEGDYFDNSFALCSGQIASVWGNYDKFLRLCNKIEYKRRKFSHIIEQCNQIPQEKICEYLKYWLREQIEDIDPESSNVSPLIHVFNLLFGTINDNKCFYDKDKFSKFNFPLKKKLFDYGENLESINNLGKDLKDLNGSFYCTYITDGIKLYNEKILADACINEKCDYYDELNKFKNKYNEYRESIIKKCGYILPCLKNSTTKYEEPCSPVEDNDGYLINVDKEVSEYADGHHGVSVSMIITPIILVLGITFVLFILYKFTPLGSLLRCRIIEEKKVGYNNHEGTNHMLHDSEEISSNFNKEQYSIKYHSKENS